MAAIFCVAFGCLPDIFAQQKLHTLSRMRVCTQQAGHLDWAEPRPNWESY